jgi:hypothetical protein
MQTALGVVGFAAALGAVFFGWRLYRRYRAAILYSGIGRPYGPLASLLAFLGIALIIAGLCVAIAFVMVAFMFLADQKPRWY